MKRRVMNIVITGAIIIVSFVLQSYLSLVSGQSFVVPNLLLIVTSIFGFIKGSNYGSVTGLFCGLLVDVAFVNDFLYNLAYYVFRFLLRNKLDFSYYFEKVILPEMIFTTFLTLIFYKLFCLLDEKILREKQENRFSFDK